MNPLDFNDEYFKMPIQDHIDLIGKYLRQCYPSKLKAAARLIRDSLFNVVPEDGDGGEKPCLRNAADFIESVGPAPTPLVAGLIGANKLTLISGLPKQGKSLFAIDILARLCLRPTSCSA